MELALSPSSGPRYSRRSRGTPAGRSIMRSRSPMIAVAVVVVLAVGFALVPVRAEQIHRHQFGGKKTVLLRGEANVRVDENEHDISTLSFHSQPSSEHIKLTCRRRDRRRRIHSLLLRHPARPHHRDAHCGGVGEGDQDRDSASRAGSSFPRNLIPPTRKRALTTLIVASTYPAEKSRQWHKLDAGECPGPARESIFPYCRPRSAGR